jgi:hypothetical protein
MSAASTAAPRDQSSARIRFTAFFPMLIVLLALGTLEVYHVMALEDVLDKATQAGDLMDGQFNWAKYEKAKFEGIAGDLLRLAPKDPNAEQIVAHFKLRQLLGKEPALMSQKPQPESVTNAAPAQPAAATNSATVDRSQATNAAPSQSPAPVAK